MKTTKRIISIICIVAMLMSSVMTLSVSAASYETPVDPDMWIDPNFETDYAYSFAFVGDTQYITCGDYYLGTKKLQAVYKYIADTADERKLEHVFILGDITDLGYQNDRNLAGSEAKKCGYAEWNIAKAAINQLNGVVPYSITRGNHDDYAIDTMFNVSTYTSQFSGCGGFYSDSNATWKTATAGSNTYDKNRVPKNTNGYVYWDGVAGTHHTSSIVNSWKTTNIGGVDYLFMTVDFNPTDNVLNWVDQTLAKYPNHKAIITTHSYLDGLGEVISSDSGSTMYLFGNPGTVLWDEVLSQHENVFMIVSGHTGPIAPTYTYNRGVNGNEVLQVLVDPQVYDAKEIDTNGSIEHGTQDTGMVLYMNFSKDGKRITFDYYSPLLNKFLKKTNHTIYIEADETANDKEINLSNLEQYGQVNAYLNYKTTTAPTLNGAIANNEYSFTRVTAADSTNQFESALSEYFSYDDEFLYYAFSFKQTTAGQTIQVNLKPNYDWVNKSEVAANHWRRYQILVNLAEDGTLTKLNPGTMLTDNWAEVYGDNSLNMSRFRWEKDVFVSATRNTSTKVNTYEFKIRKGYLDQNTPEKELQCLAYALYLGENASGNQMWHRFVNATASSAVFGDSGRWNYKYMLFVEDPISTRETASVRISDAYSGLRFKSEVNVQSLAYFKANYAKVEIGTLIAPTDLLGGRKLTHSIGTNGVDYIDVVAKVTAPLEPAKDGVTVYAGSIVNINEKNLDREFTAVGYVKLTDTNDNVIYYYSETEGKRDVSSVATAAYYDLKPAAQQGYSYYVYSGVAKGLYSPYSESQRAILASLIKETDDNKDPGASDIF